MANEKVKILNSRELYCDGESFNRIDMDKITALEKIVWRFGNDEVRIVTRGQIDALPENIQFGAMIMGLGQKLANSYAGAVEASKKDEENRDPIEWAVDSFDELVETVIAGHSWTSDSRARGPRIGTLLAALMEALTEAATANGDTPPEESDIRHRLVTDETFRKNAAEVPVVKAKVASLQAAAAAARAKEATEAAANADTDGLGGLMG